MLFLLLNAERASGFCFEEAGEAWDIDPLLLVSVAIAESGLSPEVVRKNRNGTFDVGLMQINSSHSRFLKAAGIDVEELRSDPCTNVLVGAYILHECFVLLDGDVKWALECYRLGYPTVRRIKRKGVRKVWGDRPFPYAKKVLRIYRELRQDSGLVSEKSYTFPREN